MSQVQGPKGRVNARVLRELSLEELNRDWSNCRRCPLGARARCHVLYEIPPRRSRVDLLFIGEGPGEAENAIGRPFIGPAGKVLRRILNSPQVQATGLKIGYTNMVACRPTDHAGGQNREPSLGEMGACEPRLARLIVIVEPLMIVCLGRLAGGMVPKTVERTSWQGDLRHMPHPSYIRRMLPSNAREWDDHTVYQRYKASLIGHMIDCKEWKRAYQENDEGGAVLRPVQGRGDAKCATGVPDLP